MGKEEVVKSNKINDKNFKNKSFLISIIITIYAIKIFFSLFFFFVLGAIGGGEGSGFIYLIFLIILSLGYISIHSLKQLLSGNEKALYYYIFSVILFIIFGFFLSSPLKILIDLIDGELIAGYVYYILIPANLICLFLLSLNRKKVLIIFLACLILSLGVLAIPNLKSFNERKMNEKEVLLDLNDFISKYNILKVPDSLERSYLDTLSIYKDYYGEKYFCPKDLNLRGYWIEINQYPISLYGSESMDDKIKIYKNWTTKELIINNYNVTILQKNSSNNITWYNIFWNNGEVITYIGSGGCPLTDEELINIVKLMNVPAKPLTLEDAPSIKSSFSNWLIGQKQKVIRAKEELENFKVSYKTLTIPNLTKKSSKLLNKYLEESYECPKGKGLIDEELDVFQYPVNYKPLLKDYIYIQGSNYDDKYFSEVEINGFPGLMFLNEYTSGDKKASASIVWRTDKLDIVIDNTNRWPFNYCNNLSGQDIIELAKSMSVDS